jgi:hypothetical protein
MNSYRSLQTIQAEQYLGDPIPGVTCHGSPAEVQANGCDSSRKNIPHVHTKETGGMHVLKVGNWIFPVAGGPFAVADDVRFRSNWEVPAPTPLVPVATPADPAINILLPDAGVNATVAQIKQEIELLKSEPVMPPADDTAPKLTSGQVADSFPSAPYGVPTGPKAPVEVPEVAAE